MNDRCWFEHYPYKLPVTAEGDGRQQQSIIRFRYVTNHYKIFKGTFMNIKLHVKQ